MEEIAPRIVPWARRHGRKGLPWQQNRDPYRVWVSEIMLQQTRVETVIPYYQKFIDRFPNVCTLGSADQDQVLAHWSGLGYYARARNLHRAARQVCVQYDGVVPTSRDALEQLAGIGRSTAAAILSLAYEIPEAILDGNVKRVLCRYHGVKGWPGKSNVQRQLWSHAERHMPDSSCREYTQAIMDLGATVCTRKQPECITCPLENSCVAREKGLVEQLPHPKPGKTLPTRDCSMLIFFHCDDQEVLLQRQPEQGIWGGLWSFPELQSTQQWSKLKEESALPEPEQWKNIRHTFTHFHLQINPLYIKLRRPPKPRIEGAEWVTLDTVNQRGLPAPVQRIIQQLQQGKSI